MAEREELKLPEANEFSPGQVSLKRVLELARENEGDRAAIIETIRQEYFLNTAATKLDPAEKLKQQRTRAYNVTVGLKGYGLFDLKTHRLTEAGRKLAAIEDEQAIHEAFASHILTNCHGLEVLEAVRSIQSRRQRVTKASLSQELRSRGFTLPRATTHHTKLLGWLRKAGVVDAVNTVDDQAVRHFSGVSLDILEEWALMTREQKALLRILRQEAEIHGDALISAKEIVDKAEYQFGHVFSEDQLRAKVFRPLETAGWVRLSEMKPGRGGKSGQIAATSKLAELDLEIIGGQSEWGIPPDLRARLDTPLEKIHDELVSTDKHTRGIALELLAVRIAHDLGLVPLRFRERGIETGGAEVDLIAEGAHLHSSRWLFQCKNTPSSVGVAALAKEVGMALLLRAHVIVLATTGRFAESVNAFAKELSETSYLQAVLLDGKALAAHRLKGAGALLDFFHREAEQTVQLKRPQISRAGGTP
jgi:Restriction endonuclease